MKALRVLGWSVAGLLAVLVLLALAVMLLSQRKVERRLDIKVAPVAYVDTAEAIARGKYLFESRGCAECHGSDGAGRVFIDNGPRHARAVAEHHAWSGRGRREVHGGRLGARDPPWRQA